MSDDDRDEFDHVFAGSPRERERGRAVITHGDGRRESVTPTSGIPALLAGADVKVILARLSDVEAEVQELAKQGKLDHAKADGMRRELRALRVYVTRLDATHAGTLGRLAARVHRLELRITASAVLGVSVVQIATTLMQSGHERLVAIGATILSLSGAGAYLVRRRREQPK